MSQKPKATPANQRDSATIASFGKGLAVIECFEQATPRLTISEVAARTSLERATARRFLLTLAKLGYADYDGKHFSLTPRVLRLGYAYLASTPLPAIVQRVLEPLSADLDESASASTLQGHEVVYIARASHRRVMSVGLAVGSRLPAYCSSMGRVLLGALPAAQLAERLALAPRRRRTKRTLTGLDELIAEIERVRINGYAVIDQELEEGLVSIGVPVFDAAGKVVAAINCGTQAARIPASELPRRVLPRLLRAQGDLRKMLMGAPDALAGSRRVTAHTGARMS